jgi:hypothetical protein
MNLDDKYYFLHVTKTAGTSLKRLLIDQFHSSEIFPAETDVQFANIKVENIPNYRLYMGHHGYRFIEYFIPRRPKMITILRDPIERIISSFYYAIENESEIGSFVQQNCPTRYVSRVVKQLREAI